MKLSIKKSIENDLMQWVATLSVSMLSTQMGIYYGWSSPNTARLLSEHSPIPCTATDISWLVSLGPIGFFMGAIIGSTLVEYIGGRKTLLATYSIIGISWILVLCAYFIGSIAWLFAARFIGGFVTTMLWCCGPLYLSEISSAKIRGTLVSLGMIGGSFGYLFGVAIETYVDQKISAFIYLAMILIGMALLLCLKDSPYFLVKNGKIDNAKKSVTFYRRGINVDEQLNEIKNFVEKSKSGIRDKLLQLRQPEGKKAILIIIIAFALPDLCGSLTIASYTQKILENSGFNYVDPEQWVIYSYIITATSSFLTIKVLDKLGRKLALIISSIGTTVAMTAFGVQFYLVRSGTDVQNLQWIIVGSLLLYYITFHIGFGLVPSTLLSELFPENIKSIGSLLASLSASFCAFIVVKAYQPFVDSVGEEYLFWTYAVLSFTGVPFAIFCLMETKGKTFQQIQDDLAKK